MKKSLFAIAAVTAFAGAAQAQSSVTVYGILDVGYVGANEKDTISSVTTKQTTSQLGQSAQQSSRLGFRGTEDLGGGTRAFFTVEVGLSPQDTSASQSTGATGTTTIFNNRQSFVGLAQKGIGQASIGTQYTTIHNAIAKTDPGSLNNMAGNVINPQVSGLNVGTGNTSSSSDGNNSAYTVRAGNMLALQSENISGFVANAFYAVNNQNVTQTNVSSGGNTNVSSYGLGADYSWKKLLVTANYQSFKNETTSSTTALVVTASTGAVAVTNANDNQMYAAAVYDFGILKAYANYIDRKVTSTLNSNLYVKRSAQQIGVRSFITPKVEGWASAGTGRFTGAGTNQPTANFTAFQLGTNYWLSKRSNLYAIYGQEQTSNTNIAGANANYGLSNYAVGVRHTF
jgi:predicted porin